jgi:hypothetical protein
VAFPALQSWESGTETLIEDAALTRPLIGEEGTMSTSFPYSTSEHSISRAVRDRTAAPEAVSVEQNAKVVSPLALTLTGCLFLMFVLHLGTVAWFSLGLEHKDSLEAVNHVFSTWIPIFEGYATSVVAYFYAPRRRELNPKSDVQQHGRTSNAEQ